MMDLSEASVQQFYANNIKNMKSLNRAIFTQPFLKDHRIMSSPPTESISVRVDNKIKTDTSAGSVEVTNNHEIKNSTDKDISSQFSIEDVQIGPSTKRMSQFVNSRKIKILSSIAGLANSTGKQLEGKINLLLADVLECELAFFVYEDMNKNGYFLKSVGGNVLKKQNDFSSEILQKVNNKQYFKPEDFNEREMKSLITEYYTKRISSSISVRVDPKPRNIRSPFFLILFNKYVSLTKQNGLPSSNKETRSCLKINTDFTSEDILVLKMMIKMLFPIAFVSMFQENLSERMSFLGEIANGIVSGLDEKSKWLGMVIRKSIAFLEAEQVTIYTDGKTSNTLNGFRITTKFNSGLAIVNIPSTYGIVGKVYDKKEGILLNHSPNSIFEMDYAVKDCSKFAIRNIFCAPIKIGKDIKGVVEIMNMKNDISPADAENIQAIANLCCLGLI